MPAPVRSRGTVDTLTHRSILAASALSTEIGKSWRGVEGGRGPRYHIKVRSEAGK